VQAQITWGDRKVIDAEVQACFASFPHHGLIAAAARRMRDPGMLRLLRRWLTADILAAGSIRTAIAGTPEGGVLSPVLANASLHAFDEGWETKRRGTRVIRDGEDYGILWRGPPQPWVRRLEGRITERGGSVKAAKPRMVDATDGFDCLGMPFRRKPRRSHPQRRCGDRWPSTRARQSLRHQSREASGDDDL
jgi:RNA-directed DNA polymerase